MKNNQSGFTLIELMIGIAMASIVVGVIYAAYNIQTKIYVEQDKTAEMQQNIRAGMYFLQREIRMAGYNPENKQHITCNADPVAGPAVAPGIHTATETKFGFSMDLDKNGKCDVSGENVTYSILNKKIERAAPSQKNPIAENIAEIDFLYLLENSAGKKTQTRNPDPGEYKDIMAVQVSLLAQSKTEDRKAANTSIFTLPTPLDWGTQLPKELKITNSRYRYRLLTTIINLRNMGLSK